MDLADQLGQDGFRWIFVIYPHGGSGGAARSSRAIDQACDYFHDTYGGIAVNLMKIRDPKSPPASRGEQAAELLRAQGFCPHACGSEFSRSLYLHPELVDPGYRTARSFPVKDWADAHRVARGDDWQGYFGSPREADAAVGAELFLLQNERLMALARKILAGADHRSFERYGDRFAESRETAAIDTAAEAYEQEAADRQRVWLADKT